MPYQVTGPIADIVVTGPASGETEPFRNLKISDVADRTGKHVVDALLDIAVADRLKTEFYLTPPNTSLKYLREIVDDPWVLFGVSDGGAHTKFSTADATPPRRSSTWCAPTRCCHWRRSIGGSARCPPCSPASRTVGCCGSAPRRT